MVKHKEVRLLIVEDQLNDLELIMREVNKIELNFITKRVETEDEFIWEINSFKPDIIISDYRLPSFDGITALKIATEISPETPFLIVSGTVGEERLIEILKTGATDYVSKERLEKLVPSLQRALLEAQNRIEKANNEANLFALLENTNNSIWSINTNYELLTFNTVFKRDFELYYGYEPKIGMVLNDQLVNDAWRMKQYERVLNGEKFTVEDKFEQSGETVFIETSYIPIRNNNKITGASIYYTDITTRKKSEQEIIKANQFLSVLIESMPASVYTCKVDENYSVTYVSNNVIAITGYKTEDFTSSPKFWIDNIHPDYTDTLKHCLKKVITDGLAECEYLFRVADGSYKWIYNWTRLVRTPEGKSDYIVGTWLDINERKLVEEKIREQSTLLDITPDAIIVSDLDDKILFWNRGAEKLYGWTKEEAAGKSPADLYFKQNPDKLVSAKKFVINKGEHEGEYYHLTKAGKNIIVESRFILMTNNSGKPRAILIVNTDITEKKDIESQFLRAQRMESIGSLANGIAHDLNNILTPILMATEILKHKLEDARSLRIISTVESSAKRGADIIKQILTFSKGTEVYEAIKIEDVIKDIEKIIKETFPKSLEFELEIEDDCWRISAQKTQLYQVLLNLCVNARDSMPNGGKLKICCENILIDKHYSNMDKKVKEGNYVLISISDTGSGIPPEIIDKIFESYFTTKEVGKGTGIGLSTVATIIKNHNGFINVYSELEKGTTFKIYFPAVLDSEIINQEVKPEKINLGDGECILVVDDEVSIIEITAETLEAHGYRVITANDATEAISIYAQNKKDIKIIIIDMNMPLMDGLSAIKVMKKIEKSVKIIGVSGLSENNKSFSELSDAFLEKPYTTVKLLDTLNGLLKS